jgi:hypothetical protein
VLVFGRKRLASNGRSLALLVVLAALTSGYLVSAPPARAQAVPGKTYTYVHTGGGALSITVSADGKSIPTITLFTYAFAGAPGCQRTIASKLNFVTPLPIVGDGFSWTAPTGLVSLTGSFLPGGEAEGTFRDVGCPAFVWPDGDGDLLPSRSDNCPQASNPDQRDGDGDGVGDACDATPLPDTTGPAVPVVRATARLDQDGRAGIRLACPRNETSCRGTLTIETAQKLSGRDSRRLLAQSFVLGKANFKLAGGESREIEVRLSKRGRDLVHDLGRLRARAVVKARDAAGNSKTTTRVVTIKQART